MDDPHRSTLHRSWVLVLRDMLLSLPGLMPRPRRLPQTCVTRDEIARLFAADLKPGPQRRNGGHPQLRSGLQHRQPTSDLRSGHAARHAPEPPADWVR